MSALRVAGLLGALVLGWGSAPSEPPPHTRRTAMEPSPGASTASDPGAAAVASGTSCRFPGPAAPCRAPCQNGDEEACAKLGLARANEQSPAALAEAVPLLEKSCAAKVALGCGGLERQSG